MTTARIADIAHVIRGVSWDKNEAADAPRDDNLPILRAGNIGDVLNTDDDLVWVPSSNVSATQRIRAGDIAICMSSGSASVVGKTATATNDWSGSVGAFCALLRADASKCLPEYLGFYLKSTWFRRWTSEAQGANIKNIRKSALEDFSIPLPSLPEQRRIVDLLSRADGIVRLRREAEKKAAELLPALFLDMFGDPTTNPKGWPVEALSSVCSINPRLSKDQKPESNTLVSFVPMAAVDEHFGAITRIETRPYEAVSKGYTAFQSGDVLFAKITPCMENGKAAIADNLENGLGFGSTEFHVLRPTDKAHNAWLYGLVRRESFRREAKRSFTGTAGQQRVPTEFLKELKVPIPPIRVQQSFNQALMQIRSIQNQQSAAIAKAQATFDALLARVFSQ
jgi:type I restriction enzyme S subunit